MPKVKLQKSLYYKDQPMEALFFYVTDENGEAYSLGGYQDIYGTSRDEANVFNQLSEINNKANVVSNEFDATIYSSPKEANQYIEQYLSENGYNIDEENIGKELDAFCGVSERVEQAYQYSYLLGSIQSSSRALKDMPEQVKENSLNYLQEFIDETKNPTGRTIKTPDARRPFFDRVFDKNGVDQYLSNITYHVEQLSGTKYLESAAQLYEDGMPDIAKIEDQKDVISEEKLKISSEFNFKRKDELKSKLMKQYEANHIKEAMQAKYYEETKDISIFLTPEQKKEFDNLDIKSLVEKYGTDLVSTYKGAALVAHKLHESKKQGKDIGNDLVLLEDVAKKAKSSSENPNNDMNVRYFLFNELKLDYQKFAKDDAQYRGLVSELAPSVWEQAVLNSAVNGKKSQAPNSAENERLNSLSELQQKFTEESNAVISGKISKRELEEKKALLVGKKKEESIQSAIKRVKEKHKEDRKTGENISGAIIASDIAERITEGFEFPADKEQQETVIKNLRKKRVVNREKENAKILKEKQNEGK